MVYVNDFQGTDNEKIEQAIAARGLEGTVVLDPKKDGTPWLLDERFYCLKTQLLS